MGAICTREAVEVAAPAGRYGIRTQASEPLVVALEAVSASVFLEEPDDIGRHDDARAQARGEEEEAPEEPGSVPGSVPGLTDEEAAAILAAAVAAAQRARESSPGWDAAAAPVPRTRRHTQSRLSDAGSTQSASSVALSARAVQASVGPLGVPPGARLRRNTTDAQAAGARGRKHRASQRDSVAAATGFAAKAIIGGPGWGPRYPTTSTTVQQQSLGAGPLSLDSTGTVYLDDGVDVPGPCDWSLELSASLPPSAFATAYHSRVSSRVFDLSELADMTCEPGVLALAAGRLGEDLDCSSRTSSASLHRNAGRGSTPSASPGGVLQVPLLEARPSQLLSPLLEEADPEDEPLRDTRHTSGRGPHGPATQHVQLDHGGLDQSSARQWVSSGPVGQQWAKALRNMRSPRSEAQLVSASVV